MKCSGKKKNANCRYQRRRRRKKQKKNRDKNRALEHDTLNASEAEDQVASIRYFVFEGGLCPCACRTRSEVRRGVTGGAGNEARFELQNDATLEHVEVRVDDVNSNEDIELVEDAAEHVYEFVVVEEFEVLDACKCSHSSHPWHQSLHSLGTT